MNKIVAIFQTFTIILVKSSKPDKIIISINHNFMIYVSAD